jgi:excisionase family DNA binding protein
MMRDRQNVSDSPAGASEPCGATVADVLQKITQDAQAELEALAAAALAGESSAELVARGSRLAALNATASGLRAAVAFEIAVDRRRAANGDKPEWVSPKEAAFICGYTAQRVRQLIHDKKVSFIRVGGRLLVELTSVKQYLGTKF